MGTARESQGMCFTGGVMAKRFTLNYIGSDGGVRNVAVASMMDGAELLRPYSGVTRQAEVGVLWQLKEQRFSQVGRGLEIGYGTLRRLLAKEIDEEALGFIQGEDKLFSRCFAGPKVK